MRGLLRGDVVSFPDNSKWLRIAGRRYHSNILRKEEIFVFYDEVPSSTNGVRAAWVMTSLGFGIVYVRDEEIIVRL